MTMSTRTFMVYLVSCSCFAILSALFLIHNNQKPSFSLLSSSNSNRYASGTDRIWPVNFSYSFFHVLLKALMFIYMFIVCVFIMCRNWNLVGNLFWPQLLVFLDQHVEPLVVLVVVAFLFLCLIFFLVLIPNLLLLFLNVIIITITMFFYQ